MDTNAVALENNSLMHLFVRISYRLSDQEIETMFYPGQATMMLRMLKYPDYFTKAKGLNQLWVKDNGRDG